MGCTGRERSGRSSSALPAAVELYRGALGLYAWPISPVFDRSLHFIARLGVGLGAPIATEKPA